MDFSYKSIFQRLWPFLLHQKGKWYQHCDFCCLKFKIEMVISCSPVIGCHENIISFVATVLHKIEIGFFIQVPFWDCVLLTCTKGKNGTNAVLLLFEVADGKEALYNYRLKVGIDITWVWKYLHYKTLKLAFSYKSLLEIVSFFNYTNMKNDSNIVLLLFEVEGGKETLYNYHLINDMAMLLISRYIHYSTL